MNELGRFADECGGFERRDLRPMEELSLLLIADRAPSDPWRSRLSEEGFIIKHRELGVGAVVTAVNELPDLIIVDCRVGEATALQLCQSLRSSPELSEIPVFGICWDETSDVRTLALHSGVQTFLTHPISSRELLSKFRAARSILSEPKELDVLRYADIELDERKYKVYRAGHHIPMPMLQFRMLRHLMQHPGVVHSRRELLQAVWGDTSLDDGTVTVCLVRLRKALVVFGGKDVIRQVRGIGYSLDADFSASFEAVGNRA